MPALQDSRSAVATFVRENSLSLFFLAIFLGALLTNIFTPISVAADLGIALGNTLEALVAARVLNAIGFRPSFERARDVFKFVVVAILCTPISATIGNASLWMACLLSFFIGGVIALQTGPIMVERGLGNFIGGMVGLAVCKELAPVMISMLIAGRIGSAMAAEIGSMRVYQEVDALVTLNISPIHYLVLPRVVAISIALPTLVGPPPLLGEFAGFPFTRLTAPFNLSGGPAISVPCGLTGEGLPTGLQVASAPGKDELVLRASKNPHPDVLDRLKLRVGQGITGWVAEHRQPVAGGAVELAQAVTVAHSIVSLRPVMLEARGRPVLEPHAKRKPARGEHVLDLGRGRNLRDRLGDLTLLVLRQDLIA